MQSVKTGFIKRYLKNEVIVIGCAMAMLCLYNFETFAANVTFKAFAGTLKETFKTFKEIMTMAAYVCGIGLSIMGIAKFKAQKDNPAQIPLSTPIVLISISAALLFLPTVFDIAGDAVFGPDAIPGISYLDNAHRIG